MAWHARVVKKTIQTADFVLSVEFYDTADPTEVLLREEMPFPAGMSLAEVRANIKARGATARAVMANLRTLSDLITVGDDITI